MKSGCNKGQIIHMVQTFQIIDAVNIHPSLFFPTLCLFPKRNLSFTRFGRNCTSHGPTSWKTKRNEFEIKIARFIQIMVEGSICMTHLNLDFWRWLLTIMIWPEQLIPNSGDDLFLMTIYGGQERYPGAVR